MTKIERHFRNVNNNQLVSDIAEFVEDIMDGPLYYITEDGHRELVVEVTTEWMDELLDKGIIDNFKIIGDHRNNTDLDILNGTFTLDIHFKQHNCINITKLCFILSQDVDLSIMI